MSKITIYMLARVIQFSALFNVINIYFIVSLVTRYFIQMKIIKDYLITLGVLIWMPYDTFQRIQ